ncbi:MAG: polyprenyl synthetase family protein [Acidobacteriota bacterium]
MIETEQFYADCRTIVDAELERLVPQMTVDPVRLHEAIRWSLFAGGKRFRPALMIAVGTTFGVETSRVLRTAAAVEMIHTFSLIHDDLPAMDNDDLRRGRETCHKKYGDATAILAGDVLQTLAFKALAEDEGLPAPTRLQLISLIADASGTPFGMVAGQQLDLEAEGRETSVEELETIHDRKTGALIAASARAGAIIASADPAEIGAIETYSRRLGLLFQITDDVLDVTQTSEMIGKTAGKDATAQKATYPGHIGLEGSRELAREVCDEACSALNDIGRDTEPLRSIALSILDRTK